MPKTQNKTLLEVLRELLVGEVLIQKLERTISYLRNGAGIILEVRRLSPSFFF
jgi:hypothetical protein